MLNIFQKLIPIAPIVSLYWNVAAWELWGNLTTNHNTMYTIQWKCRSRDYESFANLLSMERAILLSEMTIALFSISLYIYDIRSLAFDPYMCFLRYPTSRYISKGREVKDLILTTFTRESGQHQCEVAVFFALLRRGLCCDVRYDFRIATMFGSFSPQIVCMKAHALFTLFVFVCAYRCPTHIVLCCALFCFSSSCVPYVTSFSGLSILISPSVFSNV